MLNFSKAFQVPLGSGLLDHLSFGMPHSMFVAGQLVKILGYSVMVVWYRGLAMEVLFWTR